MVPTRLAPHRRRLASIALVGLLAALVAIPGAATATSMPDAAGVSALESAMVSALNVDRTKVGLVPVRIDARLMAIARARSADMVAKNYFSHTQPDGRNVFAILGQQSITWYGAAEIIAWNTNSLDSTVSGANSQWMKSSGHHAIVVSKDYNYVGVGLAIDPGTGKNLWTAVYLKGPDRTAAQTTAYTPKVVASLTPTVRRVKLAWTGYDPRLQVLTSGLRSWTVQRRIDGGTWATSLSSTTNREAYFKLTVGHLYQFRFQARDRAGNKGIWVTKSIDLR